MHKTIVLTTVAILPIVIITIFPALYYYSYYLYTSSKSLRFYSLSSGSKNLEQAIVY